MSTGPTLALKSDRIPLQAFRVEVVEGPELGRDQLATQETLSVGTAPGNDLLLSDETVSRYHLELARRGDRIAVRNLGSTNGTAIGAVKIERAEVVPGTVLRLGRTAIRVDDAAATVTLELHDEDRIGGFRGRSPALRQLMATIKRAAPSEVLGDGSIVVAGASGTTSDPCPTGLLPWRADATSAWVVRLSL